MIQLQVSFRGKKYSLQLGDNDSVFDVKKNLSLCIQDDLELEMGPNDFKLIYKGKVLSDDTEILYTSAIHDVVKGSSKKDSIHLIAMGISVKEARDHEAKCSIAKLKSPGVRDDITQTGKAQIAQRQRRGLELLKKASRKSTVVNPKKYGFLKIETLPFLPDQEKARQILKSLSEDPGILACMEKHQWNVGCLAEMYPEGQVGVSEVCYLGLNENRGQKILLRLRTDDLRGFRKILNIRKVLFHELAHNVYSDHDDKFFQLMRQIEKECNSLDWTRYGQKLGGGIQTLPGTTSASLSHGDEGSSTFQGGTYRLGSADNVDANSSHTISHSESSSARILAARAAMNRRTENSRECSEVCLCNSCHKSSKSQHEPGVDDVGKPQS